MRRGFLLWLVLGSAAAFSLDREAFTFTKYDLDVRIEPEQQRLATRGSITLRNDSSSPQKNLSLQISSSLTWRSIQANGKPVQFVTQPYVSDIDHTGELSEAIVSLPTEVAPGASVELTIGYEGIIGLDATRLTRIGTPQEAAIHTDWDQISRASSAVRGIGNVAWYPVATDSANLSEGNSLFETLGRWKWREQNSDMKIRIHQSAGEEPRPLTLVCNGTQPWTPQSSSTAMTGDDCSRMPLGLEIPTFALANYQVLERSTLQIAYRPEHKSNAEKFAEAADVVNPFVTEWFGTPREKIQIAELFDPGASPFEAGKMLLTPLGDTDPKLVQIALVHELTHAAFASNRAWINEGLAHFAQAAYRERQQNRRAALDFLGLHGSALATAEKAASSPQGKPTPDHSLVGTASDEFYRSKAAYVWWMLRDMIGEDALKRALVNYRVQQDKESSYMQGLIEAQAKRDLQWFFEDWVYYDRGLPDFRVESAYPRQASQGNYLVTVTIENLGGAGAEVPVIVRFDGGETSEQVEVRAKSKGVVRIATPKWPTEVLVNDGSVPESDAGNNTFKVATTAK